MPHGSLALGRFQTTDNDQPERVMTRLRGDRQAAREIAEQGHVCRPCESAPSEEADPSSAITTPLVPPMIKFTLGTGRSSGQAVKPPQFDGKNMAVKTFIDKMRGCKAVNDWSEEASVVHLMNQIQDPASVGVWVSTKKGVDTPSMMSAEPSRQPMAAWVVK